MTSFMKFMSFCHPTLMLGQCLPFCGVIKTFNIYHYPAEPLLLRVLDNVFSGSSFLCIFITGDFNSLLVCSLTIVHVLSVVLVILMCSHSKKKSAPQHLLWCFRLSQIEDSIQYLEGPNSTLKDHDRILGVPLD